MVLNGGHGVWWWRWDNIGRFMGLLRPDLSPFDEVAEMLEDTRITREGLSDLLLRSEMQTDGIALLYSPPSMVAAQVAEGPSYGQAAVDHAAWQQALFNLGLSFGYVTDVMLRQGELDPGTTPELVLPRAEALGEEEARRIIAFVEAGGTVIADLRPGRFTGRVKPRASGVLDALFGVDSRGSARATKKAKVEIRLGEGQAAWQFEGMTVDSGIVASGATMLGRAGETPVLFSHAVGRGRAILLNFSLVTYPRVGAAGSPAGTAALWRALLEPTGVAPPLTLARADGKPAGDIRVQHWRTGKIELVGIMREPEQQPGQRALVLRESDAPADFVVTLAAPRRVYDLRHHRDLGERSEIRLRLNAGRATFLALLPGTAPELRASLSSATVRLGEAPELQMNLPGASGASAVLVTAVAPNGGAADWIRTVCVVPHDEVVRLTIPIARDDPVGRWVVSVKDLYTNRRVEVPFTVLNGADE